MVNDLLLLSGSDIPFQQAQINIHQPTLKEISYIGEESFFIGCGFLNFSKDSLITEDKINLEDLTNFDILMSIMRDRNLTAQKNRVGALQVLTLMFPEYEIKLQENSISFDKENEDTHYINSQNFEAFKEILVDMFCLKDHNQNPDYNPKSKKAAEIADKLRRGRQKVAEQNSEKNKVSILNRYVSILAVGLKKDMNSLLNYTVYQLFDEFNRYELKEKYDIYVQAKMAGAKDLEEIDNWMKDLHS
jgi:hypothetical protein